MRNSSKLWNTMPTPRRIADNVGDAGRQPESADDDLAGIDASQAR